MGAETAAKAVTAETGGATAAAAARANVVAAPGGVPAAGGSDQRPDSGARRAYHPGLTASRPSRNRAASRLHRGRTCEERAHRAVAALSSMTMLRLNGRS